MKLESEVLNKSECLPFMRSLLDSVKLSNLVKGIDTRGESTMEAEDLVLNDSCQRQVVEKFCECFPDTWISILPQAFIVEAISIHKIVHVKYFCHSSFD